MRPSPQLRAGFILALLVITALLIGTLDRPAALAQSGPAAPSAAQLDKRSSFTGPLCPGSTIRYTLILRNTATAGSVIPAAIQDPIPGNTSYLSNSATNNATYDPANNRINWTGRLGPGQSATITFDVVIARTAPAGTSITNRATGTLTQANGPSTDTASVTDIAACSSATPTATSTRTPTRTPTATRTPTPTRTPTTAPVVDVFITGVEITQGIQNLNNDMPLVRDRRTMVRAYVRSTGGNVANVRARLRAFRNGAELPSPRNAKNVITARTNGGSRINLNDSFWFTTPPEWRAGDVTFRVDIDPNNLIQETNETNNATLRQVSFRQGKAANLAMVALHLHPKGNNNQPAQTYLATDPTFAEVMWNTIRFHPIPGIHYWYWNEPELAFLHDLEDSMPVFGPLVDSIEGQFDLETSAGRGAALSIVQNRNLNTTDWTTELQYVGMIHPSLPAGGWMGRADGNWNSVVRTRNDAGGWDSTPWYIAGGNSFAHELGHNRGLSHMNCSGDEAGGGSVDPDYPWPNPNCSLAGVDANGFYGFDVYHGVWGLSAPTVISNDPAASQPNLGFPLMGYQRPRWISPYEYCLLLDDYGIACGLYANAMPEQESLVRAVRKDPLSFAPRAEVANLSAAQEHLVASGAVDLAAVTGSLSRVMRSGVVLPDAVQRAAERLGFREALSSPEAQNFALVQLRADGTVLSTHPLYIEGWDDDVPLHPFLEIVPAATGVARLQLRAGDTVLAERSASPNAPTVKVLSPNGGEQLAVGTVVSWTGSDADGDTLTYDVLYSPDNGVTWRSLVNGTPGTSFTIENLGDLPGSMGQGRIRIVAMDGFLTSVDESDGAFSVPNAAPYGVILALPDGASVAAGSEVAFVASAGDAEDGPLSAAALSWRSDRDGPLGAGTEVEVPSLSTGTHIITLTVRDSKGAATETSVRIYVVGPTYLPLLVK